MAEMSYFDLFNETTLSIAMIIALAYLSGRFPPFVHNLFADEHKPRKKVFYFIYFSFFSLLSVIYRINYEGSIVCSFRAVGPILGGLFGGPLVGLSVGMVGGLFHISTVGWNVWTTVFPPVLLVGLLAGCWQQRNVLIKNEQLAGLFLVVVYQSTLLLFLLNRIGLSAWVSGLPVQVVPLLINAVGVVVFLNIVQQLRRERHQINLLETLALTDCLTGLYNHRYFVERINKETDRVQRMMDDGEDAWLSLLFIDIDHFKKYNDTYGHQAGDCVLHELARIFEKNVRSHDIVCRYGGEEFAVILPDTGIELACDVAERLRSSIAGDTFITPGGETTKITISAGASTLQPGNPSSQHLIRAADRALYLAKRNRNKVVCASKLDELSRVFD